MDGSNPNAKQESTRNKHQHKALITEQVSLIYQYKPRKKELHLRLFWDNRQNPARLKH